LAVWNCFWIPYSVAFSLEASLGIQLFNNTIDLLFFIDIIVNFRTTYITKDGEEIYEPPQIARKYIYGGRFLLDFLASVPLSDIVGGNNKFLELFGVLKLVRITRLGKIVAKLDMKEDSKAMLKIMMYTFYLVIYIHFVGCMWFLIVNAD
jgi:hypothetical protein